MQAEELINTDGWKKGSLESALADGYLRLDDIMRLEERRAELHELGGSGAEEEKTCVSNQHLSCDQIQRQIKKEEQQWSKFHDRQSLGRHLLHQRHRSSTDSSG